ncbi:DNA-binding transcriptional regulator YhcF (GntR family) [Nocardioides cavernae]|uniref:DNA-binding transcriptional regulator YhcF (GntR family) n=1 Tax=Nocardioides cavernae TaxID=1921566 RepID=A0A7Y9H6B3_9ACTN|nr:GntR family transcriptional regulator [Nocardioides cavernae]NYE38690.1 DNA-binding transcriptional regulator YhcF (GntR family) [Nocardioides cavernae]
MRLRIDPASDVAPFEQVREAVRAQVEAGDLAPGFRLPPVRALASELGLAANTVARAYKELEALGVVETRGRAGTFVAGAGVTRALREAASAYAGTVRALGVSDADAVEAVRRALA